MELKDTAQLMVSDDYKDRFIAEYHQLKIRYEKLKKLILINEAAEYTRDCDPQVVKPAFDCPCQLLHEQLHFMDNYLHILEVRAVIECIDLEGGK